MHRLIPRSLRARMLALSAGATLLALACAAWVMAGTLERFVTRGVDQRLDAQLAVLASAVGDDGAVDSVRLRERLAVLEDGPGWRWRIDGPRGRVGSADFPRLEPIHPPGPPPPPDAPPPPGAGRGPRPQQGVDADGPIHARQATIATAAGTVTLTAAAPARVIAQPIRAALFPLLSVIAALAAIFAVAAFVQWRWALRPVLALRDQVAAIRHGVREQVDEDQPDELRPLAAELNALAAEGAAALAAARGSAANLAHALKTPVATLALTLPPDGGAATQLARIEGVIRHHLARARTAAIARRARTDLSATVADVAGAIGALHRHAAIAVDVPAGLIVAVDAHDLAEIVGNVMDNAARHAAGRVAVSAAAQDDAVLLTIADDGPGIAAERREQAMAPGIRLDEGPSGDGFGLAIVRELLTLCGGRMALGEAPGGGLSVAIALPHAAG